MIRTRHFILAIWLFLLLTGCTYPAVDSAALPPTATPRPSPTVTPTATPTPAPTATPTPTPTPFVCTERRGQDVEGTFHSEAMDEDIRYIIHLPPCYEAYPDRAFPVLYLLHGWPMDETHWFSLGITRIADEWVSEGLCGPFIIVLPGVVNPNGLYVHSSGGDASFEGMIVHEMVPFVDLHYRAWRDPQGRAIGGISRGGVWALEIGLRNPDLFGIVGGHSAALALNQPLPQYDPFLLAETAPADQRLYLDAGDADWARAATIRFRDHLEALGRDVTYQVHQGAHLDETWQMALPDYLRFYTATWPRRAEELPPWIADPEELWLQGGESAPAP